LVACIIRYQDGALGMLHVDDAYRRRGLGAALLSEATKASPRTKWMDCPPCFAYILDGNKESEALLTKQGWVREDPTVKKGTGRRRAKRKWIIKP
jgi:GNAT superfamily N-acetyltransferase